MKANSFRMETSQLSVSLTLQFFVLCPGTDQFICNIHVFRLSTNTGNWLAQSWGTSWVYRKRKKKTFVEASLSERMAK